MPLGLAKRAGMLVGLLMASILLFCLWRLSAVRIPQLREPEEKVTVPTASGLTNTALVTSASAGSNAAIAFASPARTSTIVTVWGGFTNPVQKAFFEHNADLILARMELRNLWTVLKTNDAPVLASTLYRKWSQVLGRDLLIRSWDELPASDPRKATIETALLSGRTFRADEIRALGASVSPDDREWNLLLKAESQTLSASRAETLWMATEYQHVLKKAKQRMESLWLAEIKGRIEDPAATLDEKLELSRAFLAAGDTDMAKYPLEHFRELLRRGALTPGERQKVEALVADLGEGK